MILYLILSEENYSLITTLRHSRAAHLLSSKLPKIKRLKVPKPILYKKLRPFRLLGRKRVKKIKPILRIIPSRAKVKVHKTKPI